MLSIVLDSGDIIVVKIDKSPCPKEKSKSGKESDASMRECHKFRWSDWCHLRRWHLNKNLKEARKWAFQVGETKYKGPGVLHAWNSTCVLKVYKGADKRRSVMLYSHGNWLLFWMRWEATGGFSLEEWYNLNCILIGASCLLCWE